MDANDHWSTMYLTIGRYRFPRCKGRSHVICSKCSTFWIEDFIEINKRQQTHHTHT